MNLGFALAIEEGLRADEEATLYFSPKKNKKKIERKRKKEGHSSKRVGYIPDNPITRYGSLVHKIRIFTRIR